MVKAFVLGRKVALGIYSGEMLWEEVALGRENFLWE